MDRVERKTAGKALDRWVLEIEQYSAFYVVQYFNNISIGLP